MTSIDRITYMARINLLFDSFQQSFHREKDLAVNCLNQIVLNKTIKILCYDLISNESIFDWIKTITRYIKLQSFQEEKGLAANSLNQRGLKKQKATLHCDFTSNKAT